MIIYSANLVCFLIMSSGGIGNHTKPVLENVYQDSGNVNKWTMCPKFLLYKEIPGWLERLFQREK